MNFDDVFMAFFMGMPMDQEKFDKMFDEGFIKYFRDNPNGYDEVMKSVEQVPEDIRFWNGLTDFTNNQRKERIYDNRDFNMHICQYSCMRNGIWTWLCCGI